MLIMNLDLYTVKDLVAANKEYRLHYLSNNMLAIYNTISLEVSVYKSITIDTFIFKTTRTGATYLTYPYNQYIKDIFIEHQGK